MSCQDSSIRETMTNAINTSLMGGVLFSLILQPQFSLAAQSPTEEQAEYSSMLQGQRTQFFDQTVTLALLNSAKEQSALALEFQKLAASWKANRSASSSSIAMVIDPSYQRIISLGTKVLPSILQELARETDHWFWALRVISNHDPVAAQDRGNVKKMAAAWLDWGRKQGYV